MTVNVKLTAAVLLAMLACLLLACGAQDNPAPAGPGGPAEICNDNLDQDGNGLIDCADPACLGIADTDGDGILCPFDCDTTTPLIGGRLTWFWDGDLNGMGDPACVYAPTGPLDGCVVPAVTATNVLPAACNVPTVGNGAWVLNNTGP